MRKQFRKLCPGIRFRFRHKPWIWIWYAEASTLERLVVAQKLFNIFRFGLERASLRINTRRKLVIHAQAHTKLYYWTCAMHCWVTLTLRLSSNTGRTFRERRKSQNPRTVAVPYSRWYNFATLIVYIYIFYTSEIVVIYAKTVGVRLRSKCCRDLDLDLVY